MREKIPEISVKIGEKLYVSNHQEELKIARETLDQNVIEQASTYSWYAVLSVMLDEIVGTKKLEIDILYGKLYDEYKVKLMDQTGKATEGAIDSQIKQDENYITAVVALNGAKRDKGIFDAIVRAFEHRREMLVSLGHKVRKEMDGETYVKSQDRSG